MGAANHEKRRRFEQEALPHLNALFTAAMYLTRNKEAANDICQETMLRAYRFFDHFTAGTNCRAWLLTILRNVSRTRHARRQVDEVSATEEDFQRAVDSESMSATGINADPEALLLRRAGGDSVRRALDELPSDFRTAVILVDIEDLSYQEAAKVLAVPIGTVRSRISRGRALVRKALETVGDAPHGARSLKQTM